MAEGPSPLISLESTCTISWDAMRRALTLPLSISPIPNPIPIIGWVFLALSALAVFSGAAASAFSVPGAGAVAVRSRKGVKSNTRTHIPMEMQLAGKNTASKTTKKNNNPLDACIVEGLQSGETTTILIVDTNNVRGKDDFKTWNCDLLTSLGAYRRHHLLQQQQQSSLLQIMYVMDHGSSPQVYDYSDGLIVFAGPHRTADDVIAQATRFFAPADHVLLDRAQESSSSSSSSSKNHRQKLQIVVVTSDGELKQRCLRCAQPASLGGKGKRKKRPKADVVSVKVFGSPSLVSSLKDVHPEDMAVANENDPNHDETKVSSWFLHEMERVESDIRWYTQLHPPFKTGKEQMEAREHGPWKSALLQPPIGKTTEPTTSTLFPRIVFQEETWHRVLAAETMQRLLERLLVHEDNELLLGGQEKGLTILAEYKTFYEQHQHDNKSGAPVNTMFMDHRIRHVPYLQESLLKYLQTSITSLLVQGEDGTSSTGTSTAETLLDSIPYSKAPGELALELMQQFVQESPNKTQDEILARYIQEAPYHLQSSRKQDLSDLLQRIAIREKRNDDKRPQWYLLDDDDDASAKLMEDWNFQPRRGRRSEKRRRNLMEQSPQRVDEELVAVGKSIEEQWLEQWDVSNSSRMTS